MLQIGSDTIGMYIYIVLHMLSSFLLDALGI